MFLLPHREILQTHPILKEHLKLGKITDVFTLYAWVFVSDSLLHMLPYKIQKMKSKSLCNKRHLTHYLNYAYSLPIGYLGYI